jgi:dipeptidyl aminopeptidase/acylaminoacyl peptidase
VRSFAAAAPLVLLPWLPLLAAEAAPAPPPDPVLQRFEALKEADENARHDRDGLEKKIDDLLWFQRVGDVATIDKVFYASAPNPHETPRYGIANERHPFRAWAYVFVPKALDRGKKHPLLLFVHGGVHASFDTYYVHEIRELMERGYVVVAPEYRGSTGYGREYYEAIDYGGLEVDDVLAARAWALESLPFLDGRRVGILGWSHGGMISLLAAAKAPKDFQAVYAGVPVSDLVARMGYMSDDYRELFSAEHHIGKTAHEDVEEYRRRSPVAHAEKIEAPLLIHTNTNDRDVHVIEVQHLLAVLRAAGKKFESKVYEDAPGGHSFNRMDTRLALESRREIWSFLDRHLK